MQIKLLLNQKPEAIDTGLDVVQLIGEGDLTQKAF